MIICNISAFCKGLKRKLTIIFVILIVGEKFLVGTSGLSEAFVSQLSKNSQDSVGTLKPFLNFTNQFKKEVKYPKFQSKLLLKCSAYGSPPPEVSWTFVADRPTKRLMFDQDKQLLADLINTNQYKYKPDILRRILTSKYANSLIPKQEINNNIPLPGHQAFLDMDDEQKTRGDIYPLSDQSFGNSLANFAHDASSYTDEMENLAFGPDDSGKRDVTENRISSFLTKNQGRRNPFLRTALFSPENAMISNKKRFFSKSFQSRPFNGGRLRKKRTLQNLDGRLNPLEILSELQKAGKLLRNNANEADDEGESIDQIEPLTSQENKPDKIGLATTVSVRMIECLNEEHVGTYTCVAKNGVNTIQQSVHVGIKDSRKRRCSTKGTGDILPNNIQVTRRTDKVPAQIYMWTTDRFENQGKSARLFCRTFGDDLIKLWVTPKGKVIAPQGNEKYKILSNGDLYIKNITWEDDFGSFNCLVHNEAGTDFKEEFLYPVAVQVKTK